MEKQFRSSYKDPLYRLYNEVYMRSVAGEYIIPSSYEHQLLKQELLLKIRKVASEIREIKKEQGYNSKKVYFNKAEFDEITTLLERYTTSGQTQFLKEINDVYATIKYEINKKE